MLFCERGGQLSLQGIMWTDWCGQNGWRFVCALHTNIYIHTHIHIFIYFSFHDFVSSKVFNIHRCRLQKKHIVFLTENARRDTNNVLAWFIPTSLPTSRALVSLFLFLSIYPLVLPLAFLIELLYLNKFIWHLKTFMLYYWFVDQMFSPFSMWFHGWDLFK